MLTTQIRIRIEWCDCDPAGIIYSPTYYRWMDTGTHNLLTAADFPLEVPVGDKFRSAPLVSSGLEFKRPVMLRDLVVHESRILELGKTSFRVGHRFLHQDVTVAEGFEVRVLSLVDRFGDRDRIHPLPIPDNAREALGREQIIDVSP